MRASRPGLNLWNCDSFMNSEPFMLLEPSFPHVCAKIRKQKKAKPSSPCFFIFSLITTKLAGVFSACKNWLNWKSTFKESTINAWYFLSSREKDGTTSGFHVKMCARAESCITGLKPVENSSRNSLILPRAWIAMKTRVASRTSGVDNFTVVCIQSWIHAQLCLESCSSGCWFRMKASCWSESNQYTDNIAASVWSRCLAWSASK
mmetsp:Transcript_31008/g.78440  ORF Transcript_31008/g.78440 Transcript_31008/m.78440 type:complete len:205 (+) Transcript_31008:801-1415(+)